MKLKLLVVSQVEASYILPKPWLPIMDKSNISTYSCRLYGIRSSLEQEDTESSLASDEKVMVGIGMRPRGEIAKQKFWNWNVATCKRCCSIFAFVELGANIVHNIFLHCSFVWTLIREAGHKEIQHHICRKTLGLRCTQELQHNINWQDSSTPLSPSRNWDTLA